MTDESDPSDGNESDEHEIEVNGGVVDRARSTAGRARAAAGEAAGTAREAFPEGQAFADAAPEVTLEDLKVKATAGSLILASALIWYALREFRHLFDYWRVAGLGMAAGLALGVAIMTISNYRNAEAVERLPDPEVIERSEIVEPPTRGERRSRLGIIGKLARELNIRRKRHKLGGRGYVEWYLIEDSWPRPRFIKPIIDETNLPYYEYRGERYFFPRYARLADERGGVWVAVHQRGDADPLNLKEPKDHSIPAKAVARWARLAVETKGPGLFGRFGNMEPQDMFRYGLYLFIGYMILRTALKNGVIPGVG